MNHRKNHSGCLFVFLLALALSPAFFSCAKDYGLEEFIARENDVNKRSTNITDISLVPAASSLPSQYNVLLLSDIHFGANPDHPDLPLEEFRAWFNSLKTANDTSVPIEQRRPVFCICLGDSVESGAKNEYEQFKMFTEKEIEARGVPVYTILGNHDHLNNGWDLWKKYVKPYTTYYRFKTKTFSWYFLDTASGTMGVSQLHDFVENINADPNPKLVFTHYPIYGGGGNFYFSLSDPQERALLIDTLANSNVKLVAEGHQHPGSSHDFGLFNEQNIAAFRDYQSWHILTVDEKSATVNIVHKTP
ncbi:serine/threonine protein phosphatase [Spirochaetia bacterium]|nr:serine/threonine protein phosphatase [Spirochaetia bacterium]